MIVVAFEYFKLLALKAKEFTLSKISELSQTTLTALTELNDKISNIELTPGPPGEQGSPGKDGEAATITVGNVTTGAAGTSVKIVNSGTANAATLDFTIPRGADGANGRDASIYDNPPYAVCSTSASTYSKTASITDFVLKTGVSVRIKFSYTHSSSSSATLNVASTGAKGIRAYKNGTLTSITSSYKWSAGEIVDMVYDGTYWVVISSSMGFERAYDTIDCGTF